MKSILFCWLALTALFLTFGITHNPHSKRARAPETATYPPASTTNHGARVPIVVELFTSEGCSSCPPADSLLMQLEQSSPVPGAEIIALSEHVDYWNYIGWSDPFSAEIYSMRQQSYAQALRLTGGRGDVYTPQMVVDGQFEFVGSNASKAREAIAQSATLPKAEVKLMRINPASTNGLKLRILVSQLPPLRANDQAEIVLAIAENNLASSVIRGENAGRKLGHTAVTRDLRVLGQIATTQKVFETETTLQFADSWKRQDLRIVAFIQERLNRRILGAAALSLN